MLCTSIFVNYCEAVQKWKDNHQGNILVKCLSFSTKGNINQKDEFFNKTGSLIGRVGMHHRLTVQRKGNRKSENRI